MASAPTKRPSRLCSEFERILRIEHALHPVHVVGGRQLPALALEHRIVGEVDAGPDADRPRLAVGRDVGHAHRGVRDELVRPREIVVLVERVEDRAIDAVRILVARRLRIEAGLGRGKRDAQHLVRVALRRAGAATQAKPSATSAAPAARASLIDASYSTFSMSPVEARGLGVRRVALDDVALPVDQELGEVPLDRLGAQQSGLRRLEMLVERRGAGAVDVDLGEQRKRHAVVHLAEASRSPSRCRAPARRTGCTGKPRISRPLPWSFL